MGEPPIVAIAPSVDTRVRVLLLLKVMATVLPANAPRRVCGISPVPDLIAVLCWCAFRTSVVSSAGVRSAIESKCRGANGDVGGAAGDEESE
jgi:cobalamin synthase